MMQESGYSLTAEGERCGLDVGNQDQEKCIIIDLGLMQVNYKNLKRFKLDRTKLVSDVEYSVEAGTRILATYKRYAAKEPQTWMCRYNTGTAPYEKIRENCLDYKSKVDRYL
jgi:hypothetical protein